MNTQANGAKPIGFASTDMALPKQTWDNLFEFTEAEASQYTKEEMQAAIDLAVAVKGEEHSVWRVIANLRGIRMGQMIVCEEGESNG